MIKGARRRKKDRKGQQAFAISITIFLVFTAMLLAMSIGRMSESDIGGSIMWLAVFTACGGFLWWAITKAT